MLCIFGAALVPLEDAYAEAAGEKQSSFEYKQYKDQNQNDGLSSFRFSHFFFTKQNRGIRITRYFIILQSGIDSKESPFQPPALRV